MNTTTTLTAIAAVAERQHALVTLDQLRRARYSDRQIQGLLDRRLRRVRPRVYAIVGAPETPDQHLLAAVLGAGEGALASHSSAAELWVFARLPPAFLEVTVPGELRLRTKGVRVHRSVCLTDEDRAEIRGIPCTSFERTLCDTTTVLSFTQLGRVLDDGLRRGLTTLDRLHATVERLDSGPNRRLTVVQRLLAERGEAYDPGGSREELRLLEVLRAAGLPLPVQQHEVHLHGARYVLDYAWPELRVFAEWYGLPFHIGATAVTADSARLTALSADGWTPLVFTSRSVEREIVTATRSALQRAAKVWAFSTRQGA